MRYIVVGRQVPGDVRQGISELSDLPPHAVKEESHVKSNVHGCWDIGF